MAGFGDNWGDDWTDGVIHYTGGGTCTGTGVLNVTSTQVGAGTVATSGAAVLTGTGAFRATGIKFEVVITPVSPAALLRISDFPVAVVRVSHQRVSP